MDERHTILFAGLWVSALGILAGIFSADYFFKSISAAPWTGIFSFSITSAVLFLGVWAAYSALTARAFGKQFRKFLFNDALTFLPFAILGLFPLRHTLPLPPSLEPFSLLQSTLPFAFSFACFLLLKVYFFPKKLEVKTSLLWVFILAGIHFTVFTTLAIMKHYSFFSTGYDLGVYDQVVFGYTQLSQYYSTMMFPLLSMHLNWILWIFAPLYLAFKSPVVLLIVQGAVLSFSAIPLYLILRRMLKREFWSLLFAAGYLFFPTLNFTYLFDFHPDTLAVPLVLFAFYFMEKGRFGITAALLAASGTVKETLPLLMVPFGIFAFVKYRKRLWGSVVLLAGIMWFLANFYLIMPLFGQHTNFFLEVNPIFGKTIGEAALTALFRPDITLPYVFTLEKIGFLSLLFFPFGVLTLFGLPVLFLVISEFALILLYSPLGFQQILYHHPVVIVPFLYLAAASGLGFLMKRKIVKNSRTILSWCVFVFFASIFAFASYGPFALLYDLRDFSASSPYALNGREVISLIPKNAAVAAPNWALPHLSERKFAYNLADFLRGSRERFTDGKVSDAGDGRVGEKKPIIEWPMPEYIIVDLSRALADPKRNGQKLSSSELNALFNDERYGVVQVRGSWLLLKKGAPHDTMICTLGEFTDKKKYSFLDIDAAALKNC
ncbi:DUF2079 domain-containing protein [Candidatus Woesearchaeota archaeon]|nr:DUF2079 domain-containing protein [Candidatus Woesearchaeota archaeon]